jgi:hypothetical protein
VSPVKYKLGCYIREDDVRQVTKCGRYCHRNGTIATYFRIFVESDLSLFKIKNLSC